MKNIESCSHRMTFEFPERMESCGSDGYANTRNNFHVTTADLVSSGGWRGCSSGGRSWCVSTKIDLIQIDR